ncbi:MAG: YceI family protein [Sphingomonadales bacterium]|nr:YceI family protein [Sphingomonadales bacterium]
MHGNLSIRGVSLPVDLDVDVNGIAKDPYGNTKAGLTILTRINRKDFGLNFHVLNEAGNLLAGDEVRIEAEVQLARQTTA